MNRLLLGTMLWAVICLAAGCTEDDETTQGQWIKKVSYNGYARSYACSFTIGNKGYLCTGYRGANKEFLNDLWEFDMDSETWTQCETMPVEGRRYAAAFAVNGKGYVTTGGKKDGTMVTYVSDTWEYDPSTDTWTQKDDFKGGAREGALAFAIGGYGYVGTGYNDDTIGWMLDFYRFNPNAAAGSQWEIVNGYGGEKQRYGTAFVIDDVAYICCGENNGTNLVDFWKFDGNTWTQLRDIANTNEDEDYDDDYAITRYNTVSFSINGLGYIATGYRSGVTSDYWMYDPDQDLWYGDSDDDFTPLTNVHNYASGASSRDGAVSFSNGSRGFILTGQSGSSYFDDIYELLPDEEEDV